MKQSKMSIEQFCTTFNACEDGTKWAMENCATMADAWDNAKPEWLLWIATRNGVCADIKLRKFACYAASRNWKMLKDKRLKRSIIIARRFAIGRATRSEMAAAWDAARDAARAAARDARAAAWAAARAAAWDAARDAAWAAAWDAARDAQAIYIRKHFPNPFKGQPMETQAQRYERLTGKKPYTDNNYYLVPTETEEYVTWLEFEASGKTKAEQERDEAIKIPIRRCDGFRWYTTQMGCHNDEAQCSWWDAK